MSDKRQKLWARGGNGTAIVFVHGFIGDYLETWGAFPQLVQQDSTLNHCDIICWGYPSNLIWPFFHLPYVGRRLPTLPEVARALRTYLMTSGDYVDLVLVAHSMGGLVVQKMIVDSLLPTAPKHEILDRICCVLCFATPAEGVVVNRIAKLHPHLKALAASDDFVTTLRDEWKARVTEDPKASGLTYIPCAVVAGLEDNVVPYDSVKSAFHQAETAPGSHTGVVKPHSRDHTSFQILKREVRRHTWPELIKGSDQVIAATCDIVRRATDVIYVTGSRSRDPKYLRTIEDMLQADPHLVYWRVLMGPIRRQELKDHLMRVFQFRDPKKRDQGRQTLYVGLFKDLAAQPEVFLSGNERRCLALLPPLDGVGQYGTARIFTRSEDVASYHALVRDLYGRSTHLDDASAIAALAVDPLSVSL